jgi:Ca2+/Na+ antiporter
VVVWHGRLGVFVGKMVGNNVFNVVGVVGVVAVI